MINAEYIIEIYSLKLFKRYYDPLFFFPYTCNNFRYLLSIVYRSLRQTYMPSLFFLAKYFLWLKAMSTNQKTQKDDQRKRIRNNFYFENDNTPSTFYLYPFHVIRSSLAADIDGNAFKISFSGAAKIPLDKSTFDYLTKKDIILQINDITCHLYYLNIDGKQGMTIQSSLKISKAAPK